MRARGTTVAPATLDFFPPISSQALIEAGFAAIIGGHPFPPALQPRPVAVLRPATVGEGLGAMLGGVS